MKLTKRNYIGLFNYSTGGIALCIGIECIFYYLCGVRNLGVIAMLYLLYGLHLDEKIIEAKK